MLQVYNGVKRSFAYGLICVLSLCRLSVVPGYIEVAFLPFPAWQFPIVESFIKRHWKCQDI